MPDCSIAASHAVSAAKQTPYTSEDLHITHFKEPFYTSYIFLLNVCVFSLNISPKMFKLIIIMTITTGVKGLYNPNGQKQYLQNTKWENSPDSLDLLHTRRHYYLRWDDWPLLGLWTSQPLRAQRTCECRLWWGQTLRRGSRWRKTGTGSRHWRCQRPGRFLSKTEHNAIHAEDVSESQTTQEVQGTKNLLMHL